MSGRRAAPRPPPRKRERDAAFDDDGGIVSAVVTAGNAGNIVPAPPRRRRATGDRPAEVVEAAGAAAAAVDAPCEMEWVASGGATGAFPPDPLNRPTLLFDLNGVLLANTPRAPAAVGGAPTRRAPPALRPGIGALARLKPAFRLGVYSSATAHTVRRAMAAVTAAVKADGGDLGDGDALFELVLCRRYCRPAGEDRLRVGKQWDTVKPLALHFGGDAALARVALVDNDAHKALPAEAGNMVLVPTYEPPGAGACVAAGDRVLPALVDALLRDVATAADVRDRTGAVAAAVAAAAAVPTTTTSAPPSESGLVSGVTESGVDGGGASAPPAVTTTATSSPHPSPLTKKAAKRAARAAEAAAAAVADAAAVVTAPTHPPSNPPPTTDEARAAWKTAIAQTVAELNDAAGVDINHVYAYVRFKARGEAKLHLTKARLRDAVRAASGKRGALVSLPRNRALRAASAKLVARCFKLAPGATAPEIDVALASLADALAAVKSGGKGEGGGAKAAVEGAVAGVVLASVRDMTLNHGPPMALVLRHLADRYGRPVAIMGTRGAAARTALQRELEEELRVETHGFGPGTPVALVGLRCMVRPTDAECDAADAVLLAAKKEADKPRVVIAGTLANVSPTSPESAVVLTSGTASPSHDSDDGDLDVNFDTPLPVFEDRGGPDAAQAASQGGGASQDAVGSAPHESPAGAALPTPPAGPAWWEPAPHAASFSAPHAGGALDAPRSNLHHEILAFAHAATPSERDLAAVRTAVDAVARTATRLWPTSRTVLFGSQATGLALPGSDLDIVVLGASDDLANPATGFSWDQRHVLGTRLKALLKALRKGGLVAGKAIVIKARVPIIKCHLTMGVAADISLGAVNGAVAVQYIQGQTLALAPLRPLALVVKAVLKEAGLNEVFSGGLSSYCTTLMVMAHLLAAGPHAASPATADCGALLWSFFQRFGREFDYAAGAVRVQSGGFGPKLADWVKPDRPAALAVEDPQEAGKDIGSGSFNIDAVRDLFSRAADALAAAGARTPVNAPAPSPLRSWAAVQADGASVSVPPPPAASALAAIMDVDAALGRRRLSASAPRPVGRRGAGAGDRGRGPPRPAPGHPHHVPPPGGPSSKKAPAARRGAGGGGGGGGAATPTRRGGKFARAKAAAGRAPPTSVHRPIGAPPPRWLDGGGGGGGRRGAGSAKKKRKVEWA